jgi:hypothetical protein
LPALLGPTLLVLVLAGIGFAALRSATPAGSEPVDGTLLSSRTGTFRISGKVKGLYPGAQRKMKLQVRNLSGIPIRVVSIKVRGANLRRLVRMPASMPKLDGEAIVAPETLKATWTWDCSSTRSRTLLATAKSKTLAM